MTETTKLLLTPLEAAAALAVSRATIYAMVSEGQLPFVKIKGALRFRPASLDALVQDKETYRNAKTKGAGE